MKIYRTVTLNSSGNVLYEDSFEYQGKIVLCKGGQLKASRDAENAAIRARQQQEKLLTEQQRKANELKKGLDAESVKAAMDKERLLALKRQGQQSTIKTIERRQDFGTFAAKFREKYPLQLIKEGKPEDLKGDIPSGVFKDMRPMDYNRFKGLVIKTAETKAKTKTGEKDKKIREEQLKTQYERLIRQSYRGISPLKRLILSPAAIKKPRLKKGV